MHLTPFATSLASVDNTLYLSMLTMQVHPCIADKCFEVNSHFFIDGSNAIRNKGIQIFIKFTQICQGEACLD